MKQIPLLAAVAALALVSSARADDPPPTKPAAPPPAAAPTKHENKVSPEATAAYEKMEKAANHATAKEASFATSAQMPGADAPMTTKFTFKSPGDVKAEGPEQGAGGGGGGKGRGQGGGMGRGGPGQAAQLVLRYALGAFRPASDAEYDAELVKKDGKDVLSVSMFKGADQIGHTDYVLNADGLAATATTTRTMERGGQKQEVKSDYAFTWTKVGEKFRLEKLQVTNPIGATTFEIAYVDAGGFSFPSGWKSASDKFTADVHVLDLIVDGKKVETPALPPKADKKKKDKDGEGGDDDDDEKKEGGKEKK